MATVWYAGVCDTLLARVQTWIENYERGEVYATRKFLTRSFDKIDMPVQYRHVVPFSVNELTHLIRILKAEKPEWTITEDFEKLLGILKNQSLLRQYTNMIRRDNNGMFYTALVFEKAELVELSSILLAVKEGRPVATMDSLASAQQGAGKGIWEQ